MRPRLTQRAGYLQQAKPDLCSLLRALIVLGVCGYLPSGASGQVQSGVYQTLPGMTVREWGDHVPGGSRFVPFFARVSIELSPAGTNLTANLANAVLEGGAPFPLIVRSLSAHQWVAGTYTFEGDYLRDMYPSGTQYLFDWKFSSPTNGELVWNGTTGWAGGHLWYVTISNLTLVPVPWLNIAHAGSAAVQVSWATNFADYVLEYATNLPAAGWGAVTNAATNAGVRVAVTLDTGDFRRFYRLRHP